MKKILVALSIVAVILAAVLGLYIKSGYSFSFIGTYAKSFSELFVKNQEMDKEQEKTEPKQAEVDNKTSLMIDYAQLDKKFVSSSVPIALKAASTARFEKYANGILCAVENSVVLYNKNGEIEWSIPIQMSNPALKVQGSYILLFEQHGNKVALYDGEKQLFDVTTTEKVLTGNLSVNGECAIITEKVYYKGAVVVYNKSGQEIYSRSFGKNSALSVAISNSRRLCVSLLSAENGVSSQIMFLDVNKKSEDVTVDFDDLIIFDLEFSQNTLNAFSDSALFALNDNGRELWKYDYSQKTLDSYSDGDSNSRLMLFNTNSSAELCVLGNSGREKHKIKEDIVPDFCDICDGLVLYNGGRSLYLAKSNGTPLAKFVASRDMKNAYFIDSDNILIVYNSSIEFLKIEKENG